MLRAISSKGEWLKVEDEDHNLGWVPKNRTDFFELRPEAPEPQQPDVVESAKAEGSQNAENPTLYRNAFGIVGRKSFIDSNGDYGYGPFYWMFFPMVQTGSGENLRYHYMGLQTALLKVNGSTPESNAFSVPIRLRMLAWSPDSPFATGPDFSALFMHQSGGADFDYWSFGIGYSLAYLPKKSGLFPSLRTGFDFKHTSRLSIELSVGYLL